jgi:signal peptidase II
MSLLSLPSAVSAQVDSAGRRKAPYLLISLAILVLDLWSKWVVELHLPLFGSVEVIPRLLNFTHVQNTGVAFGLFASHGDPTGTWLLATLGIGALTFVGYYFWQVPLSERMLLVALALVLGGAVGNLTDRLAQGSVTDFIDFYFGTYHWHTFNIADSAITIGISLMLLGSFFPPKTAVDEDAPNAAATDEASRPVAASPSTGTAPVAVEE